MNPINNIMKLATDLAYCTDDEFGEIKVALRAAIEQALTPGEPVAWKHDCAALLTNDVELWIDACPHCGKPRPAPQPKPAEQEPMGVPQGWKLVPDVPTNEWINNLARRRTGSFEDVPFAEIHQSIAELLESAPEAPQSAKLAEQEPVAWCDQYEGHIDGLRHYSDGGSREIPLYTAPNLVRAQALEEAAGVCENTLAQHYMKQVIPAHDEALLLAACADCAGAIRARGAAVCVPV